METPGTLLGVLAFLAAAAVLLSRFTLGVEGAWQEGQVRAAARFQWEFARCEGFGTVARGRTALGVRVGRWTLVELPVTRLSERVLRSVARDVRAGGSEGAIEGFAAYGKILAGPVKSLLVRFTRPKLLLQGRFWMEDPANTGLVTGLYYNLKAFLEALVPGVQLELEPEFVEPVQDLRTEFSFAFRPYRIFGPLCFLLWTATTRRPDGRWRGRP